MLTRYAKSFSHSFIRYQATGTARTKAINTNFKKSFERSTTTCGTDAPNTLRTPISFTRCCAEKVASPSKPRQAITIPSITRVINNFWNLLSAAYSFEKVSSRKTYSNDAAVWRPFHSFSNLPSVDLILSAESLTVKLKLFLGLQINAKGLISFRSEVK